MGGGGIIHADNSFTLAGLGHEFGHILQANLLGTLYYDTTIMPASFWNMLTVSSKMHDSYWTETNANALSNLYLGNESVISKDQENYPVNNCQ